MLLFLSIATHMLVAVVTFAAATSDETKPPNSIGWKTSDPTAKNARSSQDESHGSNVTSNSIAKPEIRYWYEPHFEKDKPIATEVFFRTMMSVFDYAAFHWTHAGDFSPPNFYGLKVRWQLPGATTMSKHFTAWLLNTTISFLTDPDMDEFCELTANIFRSEKNYGQFSLHLKPPGPGIDEEVASALNTTNETSLLKRGSSPHTWSTSSRSIITGQAPISGDRYDEVDIMIVILEAASRAYVNNKVPAMNIHNTYDHSTLKVEAPPGRQLMQGQELVDCLTDLVTWQYQKKRTTGTFWTAKMTVQIQLFGHQEWKDESYVTLSFTQQANQNATGVGSSTKNRVETW